jgi:hypothetical protein
MLKRTVYVVLFAVLALFLTMPSIKANGLTGDLDHDGNVDLNDVLIAVEAFGARPGHERWNSEADLNGDSVVSMADMIILVSNFGN